MYGDGLIPCEFTPVTSGWRELKKTRISEHIEPALRECQGQSPQAKHIAVVAHGIFNAEFIGALLARTREGGIEWGYRGMTNVSGFRLDA